MDHKDDKKLFRQPTFEERMTVLANSFILRDFEKFLHKVVGQIFPTSEYKLSDDGSSLVIYGDFNVKDFKEKRHYLCEMIREAGFDDIYEKIGIFRRREFMKTKKEKPLDQVPLKLEPKPIALKSKRVSMEELKDIFYRLEEFGLDFALPGIGHLDGYTVRNLIRALDYVICKGTLANKDK